ncbi:MAG TPA: RecX family transcriptional regulator [Gaiella sp.]|nr:RecX family transcriptional regulator [Gaiella sp.]
MPVVTALRVRGARVVVELDGSPWRTLPLSAAAEAGLVVGLELDRERARTLGRALRRQRAREAAVRALSRREHSQASLAARLDRAGVRAQDRDAVLETAVRAGWVDDARFAETRARTLVTSGAGDRLVLDDLRRHGVDDETAQAVLETIEPEHARVSRAVEARGVSLRTLRYLAARGFSEESLEPLVAELETRALG